MGSKYTDTEATVQLIGCIMSNPFLLDEEGKYFFSEDDFTSDFHKVIFGSIYNLHQLGAKNINIKTIDDYLSNRPTSYGIYKAGRGPEWLKLTIESADLSNFDYYYNRIKKMTLLREYNKIGVDVSWIYDPDILDDIQKKQRQNNYLDKLTLEEIAELIDNKISNVKSMYIDNTTNDSIAAGEGIEELFESLKEAPDVGQPMYGHYVNTITRGMRLGKFYLRSAPTGVGKTRTMIADFCNCGCDKIWVNGQWTDNGLALPCVFISTELELDEIQTMIVAFLTDINEENILNNILSFEERERIKEAIQIIKASPLYVEIIPDFNLKDIENIIKRNIRMRQCRYVFFDYVHTSMKILEEITRRSGGIKLREDNILFLLSVKLKELCTEFNIFILTSTQLNGNYGSSDTPDQNLLRGAKAIADKCDYGSILLDVTSTDREMLQNLIDEGGQIMPNVKMSIYKNRRGSYTKCYLWMYADKATCRFNGLFCTDYNYELISISDVEIRMRV